QDVRMVEEPIEEGADGGDVPEQLPPVLDRAIGGEERADPFVAALDQFEEILGGGRGELPHGEVVDDQEGDGGELGHAFAAGARERGVGEPVEQHERLAVEEAVAAEDGGAGEGLREVALAAAGRAARASAMPLRPGWRRARRSSGSSIVVVVSRLRGAPLEEVAVEGELADQRIDLAERERRGRVALEVAADDLVARPGEVEGDGA